MQAATLTPATGPITDPTTNEADGTPDASNLAPARLGPRSLIGGITVSGDLIGPDPAQPRKTFDPDDLDRLARSMKQYGQMVPILVKTVAGTDRYIIIDGEQRWRAATKAGYPSVLDCKIESEFIPVHPPNHWEPERCLPFEPEDKTTPAPRLVVQGVHRVDDRPESERIDLMEMSIASSDFLKLDDVQP